MKRMTVTGIRQSFPRTRLGQEQAQRAKLTEVQKDLKHTWRRLSPKERAREYPPQKVAQLCERASQPSSEMSPEEFY